MAVSFSSKDDANRELNDGGPFFRYAEPFQMKAENRYSLDEVRSVRVREVAESIQCGHTASAISREDGPRFLRITDIQNGGVDWNTAPPCDIAAEDIPKYRLTAGDLLLARTGATTGKSFLIRDCPETVFALYLIRVRASKKIDPRYLALFCQRLDYWQQIERGKRRIGQPSVNGKILGEIQLPLPSPDEQLRIVGDIERRLSMIDKMEDLITRTVQRANRLRQSILHEAFSPPA